MSAHLTEIWTRLILPHDFLFNVTSRAWVMAWRFGSRCSTRISSRSGRVCEEAGSRGHLAEFFDPAAYRPIVEAFPRRRFRCVSCWRVYQHAIMLLSVHQVLSLRKGWGLMNAEQRSSQAVVQPWPDWTCPTCSDRMEERSGTLVCGRGHQHPILDGIPRFVPLCELCLCVRFAVEALSPGAAGLLHGSPRSLEGACAAASGKISGRRSAG